MNLEIFHAKFRKKSRINIIKKKEKNRYNKHDLIARATIKIMFEKMPEADSFV